MTIGDLIVRINNYISEILIFDKKYADNLRQSPIKILNFDFEVYGDIELDDFTVTTNKKNNDIILKIFINRNV